MINKDILKNVLSYFNENPLLNAVSLFLGVIGIILSFYFYFKSIKNKKPTYILRTINLVKEKLQKIDTVEILYSGDKINNLSITKIALWNDGKETINFSDIAQNDKLQVTIGNEFEILDCEILYHKNTANAFSLNLTSDRKSVDINFDFFDFEEEIVIQLFHTGNSSEEIQINGTVKSVKKIARREYMGVILSSSFVRWLKSDQNTINRKKVKFIMGSIILLTGLLLCITPFFDPFKELDSNSHDSGRIFLLFPGIIYCWMGYKTLKRNIPKGFNIFEEEF